ncbi:hypothetical protein B0T25DRAFT_550688 [Lasiosphaeria hispida]|uniref:Peptidase M14 domain-containing protein n=1 Tax=Lasiosphaeria hispida TaxID=260671 RepID=A0AAJ0MAB6_9PEZI|nr:hypothetical protein B0T25DRAFT_550688 [Lasiosphaeria hispida]
MRPTILLFLSNLLAGQACLTPSERHGTRRSILYRRQTALNNTDTIPVALGNRFQNGTIPYGIGTHPNASFPTVYNIAEIHSSLRSLAAAYNLTTTSLPYPTFQNATMEILTLPGPRHTVLLQAGIHARERGGPDFVINFIADLLHASRAGTGVAYGGQVYSPSEVRTALAQGIVILPLANPDGVRFDQASNGCWRRNRNDTTALQGKDYEETVGVDVNRNFASAWDIRNFLAPGTNAASEDVFREDFHGTGPLSEAEARNLDWVMGRMPDLGWFLDLHSFSGLVGYGWCHDTNQATDPAMNWRNPAYDGKRGALPDDAGKGYVYGEYIDQKTWDIDTLTASRMADGMMGSLGRQFPAVQVPHLYPVSGCASDHGRYRAAVGKSRKDVHGFIIEFGKFNEKAECPFYPTIPEHRANMKEVGAGLMELLLSAARFNA